MLLFRSEADVEIWCRQEHRTRGEVLSLKQVWELSKAWYHNRMHTDYRGRSSDEVVQVFESVGLKSAFWKPM